MKKTERLILAVLLLPALVSLSTAITTSLGKLLQGVDTQQVNSNPISTGPGASDVGTQRIAIASMTSESPLYVQPVSSISVVNSPTAPFYVSQISSVTVKGTVTVQDTAATPLFVQSVSSIAATVSNTPSTPLYVQPISSVAVNGTVTATIDQSAPGTSNAVFVTNSSTQTIIKSASVVKSSVSATTVSTQLLAADSTRIGVECTSLCSNKQDIYLNINSASAATATDYPMSPCSSWTSPAGMVPIGAIQVIAASGIQVVRCVSYTP